MKLWLAREVFQGPTGSSMKHHSALPGSMKLLLERECPPPPQCLRAYTARLAATSNQEDVVRILLHHRVINPNIGVSHTTLASPPIPPLPAGRNGQ